jgi:hypothetical protein
MDSEGRKKFDAFYHDVLGGKNPEYPFHPDIGKPEVLFPAEMGAFDVYYEVCNAQGRG